MKLWRMLLALALLAALLCWGCRHTGPWQPRFEIPDSSDF